MSIIETMNANILNRFEAKTEGTKITKYSVRFNNGKSCTRVFMTEVNDYDARQSIVDTFGFEKIYEVIKL